MRNFALLGLVVVLVLVASTGGDKPDGQKGDGGGPKRDKEDREKGCKNLLNDVAGDVASKLKGIWDSLFGDDSTSSEANLDTILANIGKLPDACVKDALESFKPGSCNQTGAETALCNAKGGPAVIKSILECAKSDEMCALLTKVLGPDGCIKDRTVKSYLGGAMQRFSCELKDLDIEDLLNMPANRLNEYFRKLTEGGADFVTKVKEFLKNLEDKIQTEADLLRDMDCGKRSSMMAAVSKAFQENGLSAEDITRFPSIIPELPGHICAKTAASILSEKLENLGKLLFKCGPSKKDDDDKKPKRGEKEQHGKPEWAKQGCEQTCGSAIVKSLKDTLDFSNSSILEKLGNLQSCIPIDVLRKVKVEGNKAVCGLLDGDTVEKLGKKVGGYFAEQCCPEKNCTALNKTTILSMGCLFNELPESVRRTVDQSDLCDSAVLEKLKECGEKKGKGKGKGPGKDLAKTCSKGKDLKDLISQLGRNALRAGLEKVRGLSKEDIKDKLAEIKDSVNDLAKGKDRIGGAVSAEIAQKFKDAIGDIVDNKELMKHISKKDFRAQLGNPDALREILGLGEDSSQQTKELPVPELTRALAKEALDFLLGSKKPEDLDLDDIKGSGSTVTGMDAEDICDLMNNTKLDSVREMCRFSDWSPKQIMCMHKNLRTGLQTINETRPMSELTEADVENMVDECVQHMDDEDIGEMDNLTCRAVCTKLAVFSRISCFIPEERLTKLRDTCLVCREKNGAGDELDEGDVDGLGQLLTAGDGTAINKLASGVLVKRVRKFGALSRMPKKVRDIIKQKLSQEAADPESEANVNAMRAFACLLPKAKRDNILEHIANIRDDIEDDLEAEEEARECSALSDEDEKSAEADRQTIRECLRDAIAATEPVDETGAKRRRRKRAIKKWTCAEVQDSLSGAGALTAEHITAMDDQEFANCLSTFGDVETWSKDMITELLKKAKTAVGDICHMSTTQIGSLGSIAYGLTKADIDCANLESDETITSLGKLEGWTQEQLTAAASKYREDRNNKLPSSFTSTDLFTLSHFLCGLTADEIKSIPHASYGGAAATIGNQLKKCAADRLEALASLAKHISVYGPSSSWNSATHSEIGIVVGGLTGSELKNTATTSMEGWSTHAIKAIHPDKFKVLTSTQLRSLGLDQAQSVTSAQYNALSADQKNSLNAAKGTPTDIKDNGNGNEISGVMPVCVTILSAVLPLMLLISQLF